MRKFILLSLLFLLLEANASNSIASSASIRLNPESPGNSIPLDFVGISFETSAISQKVPLGSNNGLRSILTVLGPHGSIRIGGNTSDTSTPALSRVTDAATFVDQFGPGWSLIYGLSCTQNNPSGSAAQAAAISGVLGSRVIYQIGNEVNVYKSGPCSGGFSNYQGVWQSIRDAVKRAVPEAKFAGPDAEFSPKTDDIATMQRFATALGSQVVLQTTHTYGQAEDGGPSCGQSRRNFCSNQLIASQLRRLKSDSALAASRLHLRLTETGARQNSDALGGALYDLWAMINLVQNGWVGVNFHSGDATERVPEYSPVLQQKDGSYLARPPLYAMTLFNYLVGGRVIQSTSTGLDDQSTLAVKMPDESLRVLVVNSSPQHLTQIALSSSQPITSCESLLLQGGEGPTPSVTLGGSAIGSDGSFSPKPNALKAQNGSAIFDIPANTALLLTLH